MFVFSLTDHICKVFLKFILYFIADLKSVFLSKQPRRSNRLEMKKMENIVKSKSLGYFDILPLEVKFHVLTYLSSE